ncbi:hypothetical protein PHYBLDRAFT_58525 [Phycomyces blakesleeanus NRRL 1555(-)]|uniref:Uncharacterized protein n=1 Tax=Phycomyces blakesleeanus (strain ATCC 8743b / DSM 1359 / FGSC 10004 / NBRC 33097 / NRRL 1555) TaxID=763407 RepID=A0A167QCF9_PHYB8|nr:hypothetical protein PHYBLDRAFT_58525 [Phycomyces blakesleeanus NRRL 1555(-)]OAD79477.1 hypothetical protein PHYBLDRAFT_58525 [Phycomyces blakesleeanus NRRL 1555(-)]|eukprot:XP_018297517.1 hypothetical protein PHYBLDRAFT_58525 [Phycomyces blakesleeanus NRRL 1555(-)]
MSSTSELYNKKCYCIKCSNNQQGYSFVSTRTLQRHNKRAKYEDMERSERTTSNQQTGPMEAMGGQTNLPVWEGAPISVNEVAFSNESNGKSSDGDKNDNDEESNGGEESEDNEENIVEIEVEEFDTEDPFATPNMPENSVHRFIATFVVMFASRYVVNKGAVVLIEFINKLLLIYKQDFQLPKSYVYQSLTRALKILFLHPNFKQKIMHWNQEFKITDTLCDVYDSEAWTDLKDNDDEIFVEHPRSLMLTLNID